MPVMVNVRRSAYFPLLVLFLFFFPIHRLIFIRVTQPHVTAILAHIRVYRVWEANLFHPVHSYMVTNAKLSFVYLRLYNIDIDKERLTVSQSQRI